MSGLTKTSSVSEKEIETVSLSAEQANSFQYEPQESSKGLRSRFKKFSNAISLQDTGLSTSQAFLINKDLQPVLDEEDRPWDWYNFVFLWISESFNVNTWQIASTGVQAGLSWWETWISVWMGYGFLSLFVFVSQRVGSHYHIPFPVSCRASFGTFGSIWPVLNRVVMAIIWYSVQAWIGGQCVQLMLMSIFGSDLDTRIHNGIPGSGTTTFQFLSFFLFCLFSLPFIYFRPQTIRHLFTVKSYLCSTAGIAFLVWTIVKAGGIGPVISRKTELSQSEHAWTFINSTMSALANFSTFIVNAPDFSRLAKKPSASAFSQLVAIPSTFALTSLIGILASSASTEMYGETYWSPLDLLARYIEHDKSSERAGVFFIALCFAIAQVGTNISANSISAGTDGSALFPKYINIRRGGFICAAVAFCICPWHFFTTSANFTTYLSAYSVFLSAIAGVIAADYTMVRRGYINVFHLYSNSSTMNYSYNKYGINWRAYVAYICGILPNVVGFAGAVGQDVPIGATYVYNLSFFSGYIVSFLMYCTLVYFFPVKGMPLKNFMTEKGWFEENLEYKLELFNNEILNEEYHPDEYNKSSSKLFN
jgi:NCS1 family nucleobase:cation symporter-1